MMIDSALKTGKPDNPVIAIATVLSAALIFSLGDVIVKLVSVDLGLWQILVLRALISIPVLIVICRFRPQPIQIIPNNLRWTVIRSALMILMWVTYYAALLTLPVSVAASVYYTMPLFVTIIAALFIGDRIGRMGWVGIAVGFVGVLLIVQPDTTGITIFIIFPLAAAIFFAMAMIITRVKIRDEHPFVLTINLQLGFLITGALVTAILPVLGGVDDTAIGSFFGGPWKPMGMREVVVLLVLAVIITAGNIGTVVAFQRGKPSIISTFSFSYIPFVTLWGFAFFGEVPDLITIMGVLLIITAGTLAVQRQ